MFDPNTAVIDAFVKHTLTEFQGLFAESPPAQVNALERAARTALESLLNCDCPYHDLQHTILVADVGQTILHGRQLARGDLSSSDWLHAVVAMFFHDIGYLRDLLPEDSADECVVETNGRRITPPKGSTDAFMTPYHVTRGGIYVQERFAQDPAIDTNIVADCIEMTRFPVPDTSAYADTDTLPGLVRAADLIGQMADPQYLQKLSRLFAEFVETGEATRLGFDTPNDLRRSFPEFFYVEVQPYIGDGVAYLKRTQKGRQWIANLYHHLHINDSDPAYDPKIRTPELVVNNVH